MTMSSILCQTNDGKRRSKRNGILQQRKRSEVTASSSLLPTSYDYSNKEENREEEEQEEEEGHNIKSKKFSWHTKFHHHWNAYTQSGNPAIFFWMSFTMFLLLFFVDGDAIIVASSSSSSVARSTAQNSIVWDGRYVIWPDDPSSIVFSNFQTQSNTVVALPLLKLQRKDGTDRADYGDLIFHRRPYFQDPITIERSKEAEDWREAFLQRIDRSRVDQYQPASNREIQDTKCRTITWLDDTFPTCNPIHEHVIERYWDDGYDIQYLNSGHYRDAFRVQQQQRQLHQNSIHFVLKRLALKRDDYEYEISKIQKEAILLERLSPSPRILDIYGHCGTSVLTEAMASDLYTKVIFNEGEILQDKLDHQFPDTVHSFNNLTISEKLQISLEMAKSIADLHGYKDGPIIHADANIEQWLIAPDGSIKLNDFNNIRPPRWDDTMQQYCISYAGYGGGFERSPEEYSGDASDESVDVYALGSSIYPMLTGLWPFYDDLARGVKSKKIAKKIIAGERPYIDPRFRTRSYIEEELVKLTEQCWMQNRLERPSIFDIVTTLERVKTTAMTKGEVQPSSLIKIPLL